jgi:Macrocin-O-methyltransferase (TylF)
MRFLRKPYKTLVFLLSLPILLQGYFSRKTGKEYNIGFFTKIKVFFAMLRNDIKIPTASFFIEHLIMAEKIMNIPKDKRGIIIECGSYKGGSSSNLSLVCSLCKRELHIFDSFEGLPEPEDYDKSHPVLKSEENQVYKKGDWAGSLEEVKNNIKKYGKMEVCSFHKGYFKDTLPHFNEKSVFIFLDVDLRESLEQCIKYLWNNLQDNCCLFTHEAPHFLIASLFFDKEWWLNNFGSYPPGLIGAGTGLGLVPEDEGFKSSLGYTIKNPFSQNYKKIIQN